MSSQNNAHIYNQLKQIATEEIKNKTQERNSEDNK